MSINSTIIKMSNEFCNSNDTSTDLDVVDAASCCNKETCDVENIKDNATETDDRTDGRGRRQHVEVNSRANYAASKNVAEGILA